MHAICLVQGDYGQPWGRTDGSLNTGTWLRKRVSRAVGSRAHGHRPSWHYCRRLYWKNSPVFRPFPPTQKKKESMVYGVMGWQNFTHALVGDHEKKKKKTTGKQERMQNYQLWIPRAPVAPWQVPELGKQSTKNTGYTTEWDPKEANIVP